MSDESHVVRGIDWRSTFPFVLIFRSFRVAIHPSKLLLALMAMLLIFLGGSILDAAWKTSPRNRAVPRELGMYVESRNASNSRNWFIAHRNEELDAIAADHQRMLKSVPGKPNATQADLEWAIKNQRDRSIDEINKSFDKSTDKGAKSPDDIKHRDAMIREVYTGASLAWREAHEYEGVGLFSAFTDFEIGQLNSIVRAARSGNFLGPDSVSDGFVGFFAWGPLWAFGHHYFYFTIFGIYFLIIWSIFGGAIARIAAVHIARDEKISIRQALAFSTNKFLSFFSAPIIPIVLIVGLGLLVAVGGIVGNIPGFGPTIFAIFFFLALIAGFVMALGLLGLIGGIHLMYPTIAVEGSDSFDAISRSFSYLYARPWRLIFYTLVAVLYGALCYTFARFFIYLMLWVTHLFAGMWFFYTADNGAQLFSTMWPDPMSYGRLSYDIDFFTLTGQQSLAAGVLAFWIYLTISLLGAFAICFYFSANTVIYFLMRNEVDATELDDVYLEQSDEDFAETPTTVAPTPVAGATAGENPDGPPLE